LSGLRRAQRPASTRRWRRQGVTPDDRDAARFAEVKGAPREPA
jgi:hypothetical protein